MHLILNLSCLIVCYCIYVQFYSFLTALCLHTIKDPVDLGFNEHVPDDCDYLDYSEFKTDKDELTVMQLNIRGILNKQCALK